MKAVAVLPGRIRKVETLNSGSYTGLGLFTTRPDDEQDPDPCPPLRPGVYQRTSLQENVQDMILSLVKG